MRGGAMNQIKDRKKARRLILLQKVGLVAVIIAMLGVMLYTWFDMAFFDFPKWAGAVIVFIAGIVIDLMSHVWDLVIEEEGVL